MDKTWMSKDRLSKEYEAGVEYFLRVAQEIASDLLKTRCPCRKCSNFMKLDVLNIKGHLYCNGIDESYVNWIWHGEVNEFIEELTSEGHQKENLQQDNSTDPIVDMVRDADERFVD